MTEYFIGVNSGTSLDGIDCALFGIETNQISTQASYHIPFPEQLCHDLKSISTENKPILLSDYAALQNTLAEHYAKSIQQLINKSSVAKTHIRAIGCHGQTLFHAPESTPKASLQMNNGAIIAQQTGIDTIVDFRSADLANGGQGAPLASAFHQQYFFNGKPVAVVNLGGIANISIIESQDHTIGFDTGPANCLMDMWSQKHFQQPFDQHGQIASTGKILPELLQLLLQDPYFHQPSPKSTGVDYFNLHWIDQKLADQQYRPQDVQTTLCELTAQTIVNALADINCDVSDVILCGGGALNTYLVSRIQRACEQAGIVKPSTSRVLGVEPQWVECACFAWLAQQHVHRRSVDLRKITGATQVSIPGAYYPA